MTETRTLFEIPSLRVGVRHAPPGGGGGGAGPVPAAAPVAAKTVRVGEDVLVKNAEGVKTPHGDVLMGNLSSVDNHDMRYTVPDPFGRVNVTPNSSKPFGPDYIDSIVERVKNYTSQPWYQMVMTVAGITNMKNTLASAEFGGLDSIVNTIVALDKLYAEAQTSGPGAGDSFRPANRIVMETTRRNPPGAFDRAILAQTTGVEIPDPPNAPGVNPAAVPANTPRANISDVPPGLMNTVYPSLPDLSFSSRESMIKSLIQNGKLSKDILDAVDKLFPVLEPKATSIKYHLNPLMSGFVMLNPTITAQASQACLWIRDELIDPETRTSPSEFGVDVEMLHPALLSYGYPTEFGALVGYMIQQNNTSNGLPLSPYVQSAVATNVVTSLGRMLSLLTQGRVRVQRSRGVRAMIFQSKTNGHNNTRYQRPWLGSD